MLRKINIDFVYILFVLIIFVLILRANLLVPILNEDFDLNATGKNLIELYNSCKNQYLNWNARIGDVLSIILSILPISIYNTLNAVATLVLVMVISYIPTISLSENNITRSRIFALVVIFLSLIFLVYRPGEVFLWRTGSTNYLHPTILVLIYIIPYLIYLIKRDDVFERIKNRNLRYFLIAIYSLFGIIIGHSNENTSPSVVLFFILSVIFLFINKIKIKSWVICGLLATLLGTALLIFGPSTTHRINVYSEIFGVVPSPLNLFFSNFTKTFLSFFYFAKYIILFFAVSLFFIKKKIKKDYVKECGIYFSFAFISAMILASAPYQEPRAFFISSVLMIMIIAKGVYLLSDYGKFIFTALLIFVFLSYPFFSKEYGNMKTRYNAQNKRIESVKKSLELEGDIYIAKMPIKSSPLVLVGGTDDEATRMTRYFKLENRKIIIK